MSCCHWLKDFQYKVTAMSRWLLSSTKRVNNLKSLYKHRNYRSFSSAQLKQEVPPPSSEAMGAEISNEIKKPSKWKRRGKVLAAAGLVGYGSYKAWEYYTTPKFNDKNFVINNSLINDLKLVGRHSSEIKLSDIDDTIAEMKKVFKSNITRPLSKRREVLQQLLKMFEENKEEIAEALRKDLGRDKFLAIAGDVLGATGEIKHMLGALDKLNAPSHILISLILMKFDMV